MKHILVSSSPETYKKNMFLIASTDDKPSKKNSKHNVYLSFPFDDDKVEIVFAEIMEHFENDRVVDIDGITLNWIKNNLMEIVDVLIKMTDKYPETEPRPDPTKPKKKSAEPLPDGDGEKPELKNNKTCDSFLEYLIEMNKSNLPENVDKKPLQIYKAGQFYQLYKDFCIERKYWALSSTKFGTNISKCERILKDKRRDGVYYNLNLLFISPVL